MNLLKTLFNTCFCLLIVVLSCENGIGQNWHPFPANSISIYWFQYQPGDPDTLFFAARIDSTVAEGNDSAAYLYRLDRPGYFNEMAVDCNGDPVYFDPVVYRLNVDHYLGRKMLRANDGVCRFVSSVGDTFRLRTFAGMGASWTWSPGVTATVTNVAAATVLGVPDSIKTISLTNGKEIILSREHGFVKTYSFLPFAEQMGQFADIDFHLWGIPGQNLGRDLPHTAEIHDFQAGDQICKYGDLRENSSHTYEWTTVNYTGSIPCIFPTYSSTVERYREIRPYPGMMTPYYYPTTAMTPPCTATSATDSLLELLPYEHNPYLSPLQYEQWIQTGYQTESAVHNRISCNLTALDNLDTCGQTVFLFESKWTKKMTAGLGELEYRYVFTNEIDDWRHIYAYEKGLEGYGTCEDLHALTAEEPNSGIVKVHPNPASQFVQIELPPSIEWSAVGFEILDLAGKQLLKIPGSPQLIDVSTIPNGMYALKITVEGRVFGTQRIIVQR
ncbi:MAG: T9SS type A sorting domain-containing protein [Bacteroidetes bacterium]|nr:T9SS type A sorting domain-containing protein [Bacteroidota bacterium]